MEGMKLPVALLFVVFAWSSWIDVNGLWVELPLLVNELPEKWNLPSYITVIIQVANIGPILYTVLVHLQRRCQPGPQLERRGHKLETGAIFAIIVLGAVAMFLLALFWDVTSSIGGVEHSTVLLLLVFAVSLVDCTSSVTFLPFLAHFKPAYMTAYYVGEGMSGLLPAAFAFIQGSGEYTCVNVTGSTNNTAGNGTATYGTGDPSGPALQPLYTRLLFSVQDFFFILFAMLCCSIIAFAALKFSSYCKSELIVDWDVTPAVEYRTVATKGAPLSNSMHSEDSSTSMTPIVREEPKTQDLSCLEYGTLLAVMAVVCALYNGALPSIQIYSLRPYGQLYYSLGVKLATLANPLACFLGFCLMPQSFVAIGVLTATSVVTAVYIIVIAGFSPEPPAEGAAAAVVMVVIWVVFAGVSSYLRLLISRVMMRRGHTGLFWLGVSTQVGSFVGAIVTFLITTTFSLIRAAPTC